jgi:hypothetical protein
VQNTYQVYLHRTPGPTEVAAWENLFQRGLTQSNFIAAVIESGEAQSQLAGNSQFVSAMYNDVLGRTPSSAEVNAWVNLLQNGVSRNVVVNGFLGSGEYQWHLEMVEVAQFYQNWLGRTAGASELNAWVNLMASGLTYEGLEAALVGSMEYYNRALAHFH